MSMYYHSSYEQEQHHRKAEQEAAPKQCPHCHVPINQQLSAWDRVRYHCGSDKCRKAVSRANIAERKRLARSNARARMLRYCDQYLDRDQKHAVMNMCDMLMQFSYEEGHQIAERVVTIIEAQRCKHDRISVLIDNASVAKRRADKAEEHNQQLERLYKERIAELESELHVYQLLENAVHNIATRQLQKQPDQEEQPQIAPETEEVGQEDPDRARVLEVLAKAGIQPYTYQEDEDDTENGADDEEYDDDEE